MTDTITPASPEIIEHTLTEHRRGCLDMETRCFICPCDDALIVYCVRCWRTVVAGFEPGKAMCPHGRDLLNAQRYGGELDFIDGWHDVRCGIEVER